MLAVSGVMRARAPSRSSPARALRGFVALALCAGLGACSLASESLWPSIGSGAPAPSGMRIVIPPGPVESQAMASAPGRARGAETVSSTAVGQRVVQLRDDAARLVGQVSEHGQATQRLRTETFESAQRYQGLVAQINTRLQVGTTPGNPVVTAQYAEAQAELERFSGHVGALTQLAGQIGASASLGTFLLESLRNAYAVSGAVDEDHRALAELEDEVGRVMVTLDRLRLEGSEDVARHSAFLGRARVDMTTLAAAVRSGEFFGPGLAARAFAPASAPGGRAATAAPPPNGSRPLVVVRFDRANPNFEQTLYSATSRALELRPQSSFEIVGVAAARGGSGDSALAMAAARRQSEQVMRAMIDMGMPAARLRLSARSDGTLANNEVHVFIR